MTSVNGLLVLKRQGDEPAARTWPITLQSDGSIHMAFQDLADALEIMRGSYIHRLEIQYEGKSVKMTEQLRKLFPVESARQDLVAKVTANPEAFAEALSDTTRIPASEVLPS